MDSFEIEVRSEDETRAKFRFVRSDGILDSSHIRKRSQNYLVEHDGEVLEVDGEKYMSLSKFRDYFMGYLGSLVK